MATFQPSPTPPSTWSSGTSTSSKKTSANPVSPSSWAMGRTVTPGVSIFTRKYVRPRCRSASGSERNSPKIQSAKAPREHHVFCPLSTHDPTSPPAPRGAAADGGEVAAGVGLGPALAPDLPARRHGGEIAGLLLRRSELEQRGGQEEDAVLAHTGGRRRPVVLLLEDQPLEEPHAPASVLLGPRHHRPPGVVHDPLPGPVGLEARGGVERGKRAGPARRAGSVGLEPRPHLGAELLLLGREPEVHGLLHAGESDTPPGTLPDGRAGPSGSTWSDGDRSPPLRAATTRRAATARLPSACGLRIFRSSELL